MSSRLDRDGIALHPFSSGNHSELSITALFVSRHLLRRSSSPITSASVTLNRILADCGRCLLTTALAPRIPPGRYTPRFRSRRAIASADSRVLCTAFPRKVPASSCSYTTRNQAVGTTELSRLPILCRHGHLWSLSATGGTLLSASSLVARFGLAHHNWRRRALRKRQLGLTLFTFFAIP